jgi:hypothetical protein
VPLTDQHDTLPFVNIFYASDSIGISVINSKTNKAFYWNNVLKSTTLNYPVTLRSQAGTITTTCTLNQQKMLLVGTSLGDIFPLTCKNDGMELVSRTEDSVVSYISSFFVQKPWLDSPAVQNKERIVSIVNVLDAVYVLSEKHVQVLHVNNDLQLEVM